MAALRPTGPYPLLDLAIASEQGPAKTVTCKLLKALIDPSIAPVRALARDERDLMIAANNTHTLAFDNISGSCAARQLNTDDAEVPFEAARPMLLKGIEDVIGRPDLADRAIILTCRRPTTPNAVPSL